MDGVLTELVTTARRAALLAVAAASIALPAASSAFARGPDNIADVAEKVIDAVVNISTSQNVTARNRPTPPNLPNIPNDPQLDDLFRRVQL